MMMPCCEKTKLYGRGFYMGRQLYLDYAGVVMGGYAAHKNEFFIGEDGKEHYPFDPYRRDEYLEKMNKAGPQVEKVPTDQLMEIAKKLKFYSEQWRPETRLLGNVTAKEIHALMDHVLGAVEENPKTQGGAQ